MSDVALCPTPRRSESMECPKLSPDLMGLQPQVVQGMISERRNLTIGQVSWKQNIRPHVLPLQPIQSATWPILPSLLRGTHPTRLHVVVCKQGHARIGIIVDEGTLIDLIERAQSHSDPDAFEGLYVLFANRVFRYLWVRLKHRETAEEITSRVFVRLIEKIDLYKIGPANNVTIFSAWLYRIAHNLMVDVLRARKRANHASLVHAEQIEVRSVSSIVVQGLEIEDVLQKLRDLNDSQQDVIILRFFEGLSIAETAQIMQKSEGAVKALQHRALENLRRQLIR